MKELKKESCIIIKPFMVTELNLKGNSLLLYALIYGISVNKGAFYGSIEYMQTWCNASNRNVIDCLKELIKKGLITKRKNGNTVLYTANTPSSVQKEDEDCPFPEFIESEESSQQSEESSLVGVKKVHSQGEESSHNILDINLNKKEFINSSPNYSESEPFPEYTSNVVKKKLTKTELNKQFISSLSEKERVLSERCVDLMIDYLKPISTYDPVVNKISWQADIARRASNKNVSLETVLKCIQFVHDDSFERPLNASPEKLFKRLDCVFAKAIEKERYSLKTKHQNPRTTGGMDYHKQAEHYDIKY